MQFNGDVKIIHYTHRSLFTCILLYFRKNDYNSDKTLIKLNKKLQYYNKTLNSKVYDHDESNGIKNNLKNNRFLLFDSSFVKRYFCGKFRKLFRRVSIAALNNE